MPEGLDPQAEQLLKGMLLVDSEERLDASEVVECEWLAEESI